jgi:hypothetical protein
VGLYGSDQSVVKKINTQDRKTAKIYPKAANITEPRMVPRSRHLGVFNTILFSKAYLLLLGSHCHAVNIHVTERVFSPEFLDIPL